MWGWLTSLEAHVLMCIPVPDAIAPRSSSSKGGAMPVLEGDTSHLEGAVNKGEGRATLRLKKDGQAVVEEVVRR